MTILQIFADHNNKDQFQLPTNYPIGFTTINDSSIYSCSTGAPYHQ